MDRRRKMEINLPFVISLTIASLMLLAASESPFCKQGLQASQPPEENQEVKTRQISTIADPQSAIANRQSPIGNPPASVAEVKLDNGLKVLLKEVHTVPLISVSCWYRVGSKDEQIGSTGISHWVEHMNFKGTRSFSRDQMKSVIEDAGGYWNGYTSLDQTAYFETVDSGALEEMLKLEAERMTLSLFDPTEVERERSVIISELRSAENEPRNLLDIDVTAAALKVHPYRWPTIGWLNDLERITRDEIYQYYQRYYGPNNAVLVIVGDFQTQAALDLVMKYFAQIRRRADPVRVETFEPNQQGERRVKIVREGTTPYLQIAFRSPDILSDEFYSLLILDATLAGAKGVNLWSSPLDANAGRSSRLYRALIDKRIATNINSSVIATQRPYLYKLTITLPDRFQYQAAEEALFDELEKLKHYELTDEELSKAKNQWVARTFLDQDSVTKSAHQLGYFESIASFRILEAFEDKINRVSKEDLRRFAFKYFDEKARTVGWFAPVNKEQRIEVEKLSADCRLSITGFGLAASGQEITLGRSDYRKTADSVGETIKTFSRRPSPANRPAFHQADSSTPTVSDRVTRDVPPPTVSLALHRIVLPNGVTIVAVENKAAPTIALRASMKAGAMREGDDRAGIAGFVGRMLERGTKSKNVHQLAERLEFLGANLTIGTDYLITTITVNGLTKDAERLIELLAEIFQGSDFPAREVEKVKAEILTELREDSDNPELVADQVLRQRIYPVGHPFRRSAEGTVETVERLKPQDLLAFYKRFYRPDQLVITVSGDIVPDEIFQVVEKNFAKWSAQGAPEPFTVAAASPGLGAGLQVVTMANKSQCEIAFGLPGISIRHPDYYPMLVLNHILGQAGLGGRLGRRIREQEGLAYYANSSFDANLSEGPFVIRTNVSPEQVQRAVALIKEEIQQVRINGVTSDEVKSAKRFLIHSLPVQLESNEGIVKQLERIELFQLGEDYLSRLPDLIEGVSPERLLDCARALMSFDEAALVIAGPYEQK